jgi:DNA-binding PucR family transcriptional regulator
MNSAPAKAPGRAGRSTIGVAMAAPASAEGAVPHDGMPPAVRELAADLMPSTGEISQQLADHLAATVPELAAHDDDELREETRASSEANVDQVLRLLRAGASVDALVVPIEAAEYVRGLVQRGVTLPVLLRSYRVGHAWFWDRWSQALHERLGDPGELLTAQERSSAFLFAYIDRISGVLVEEYGNERDRLVRGATQLRAETVRAILTGEAIDEEVAVGRLGYELRRQHVALRVTSSASEVRGLERAAGEAAAALGSGEPLVVPSGVASLDVWWGSYEPPVTEGLESYEPPEGIRVAFGSSGHGVAGFRRSHSEAVHAARVAALAGDALGPVTGYRRVELVSLLASDLPRARRFVAAQLGPLASRAESAARLRETVLAFLIAGGSGTRVAKELYVHQNTVAYRVKRAEELLGRRVTEDPVELTCALTLAAAIGSAVLADDDDGDDDIKL